MTVTGFQIGGPKGLALGLMAGFLFATGQLNQWLDHMGSPVAGALAGLSYGGPSGQPAA